MHLFHNTKIDASQSNHILISFQDTMTREDAEFVCRYHLRNTEYITPSLADHVLHHPQTLHLFATNEPKHAFDRSSLKRINSATNPIAIVRPIYAKTGNKGGKAKASHFKKDNQVLPTSLLCIGAKVEISGRNIYPEVGLYNSSMGTIVDIVYNPEQSPNDGDLPKYVLVRLSSYNGPSFIPDDSKVVPFVPITRLCPTRCCSQTFIPLRVCFAKTIHTFQGSSAGPVSEGQPQNAIQKVVLDIGSRQFEGNNPGLSYTAFSRATQLGDPDDLATSALFFDGPNVTPARLMNITQRMDCKGFYKKVILRQKWVQYLKDHTLSLQYTHREIKDTFHWATQFRPTNQEIEHFHSVFV
jgi:hypothetical protein